MTPSTSLDRCRNIGILASQDAGRTTTTERMLASARPGTGSGSQLSAEIALQLMLPGFDEVDELPISLTAAAAGCDWRDGRINIVDLAGQDIGGALTSVLDGVVLVVDGSGDAERAPGASALSSFSGAARIAFVNKLDRAGEEPGIALQAVMARLDSGLGAVPVALHMPYGKMLGGVVDLVEMNSLEWTAGSFEKEAAKSAIPAHMIPAATQARAALVSAVDAEANASPMALKHAIRASVLDGRIMPVLCGSAYLNRGIGELLDAILDYLPAPSDLENLRGRGIDGISVERRPSEQEPFAGVAFGTVDDPTDGTLTFVRVFSGAVATGGALLNTVSAIPEQIGRMVRVNANRAEEVGQARAGDIVAVAGLQHTSTGDTLCDPANPLVLEHFPLKRMPAVAGLAKH